MTEHGDVTLTTSVRLNNDLDAAAFVRIAALAEEEGFDQIWVSHDLFWRSAPVLLAEAARATSRIRLGVAVFNPVTQHVAEIAMAAATLQEVSAGRFLLGLGAGADEFLGWAGVVAEPAVRRTRRALLELRSLLRGEAPAGWPSQGRLRLQPAPTPIYVGGMGPRMLELAGELADGALPLLFPPEHFATAAAQVAAGARRARRDPRALDLAACIWSSVGTDDAGARRALAAKIAYYGASFSRHLLGRAGLSQEVFRPIQAALAAGDEEGAIGLVTPRMLGLGIAGDAGQVRERCRGLVAAGARHLSFGPPLGADPEPAVRVIARRVVAPLREATGTAAG
jgi:5,10-methylenetetrahydromethanopterin reductase